MVTTEQNSFIRTAEAIRFSYISTNASPQFAKLKNIEENELKDFVSYP